EPRHEKPKRRRGRRSPKCLFFGRSAAWSRNPFLVECSKSNHWTPGGRLMAMELDHLNVLREISEIISSSLQLNEVFDRVMRVVAHYLGIERGRLVIYDVA